MTGHPEGATDYLDSDVRDPDRILAEAAQTLDFTQPVGLTLVSLLHFLPDTDDPYATVARLASALPSGSYLVISHGTYEVLEPEQAARFTAFNAASPVPFRPRDRQELGRFFDGLELADPGIVPVAAWRDDDRNESRRWTTTFPTTGRSPASRRPSRATSRARRRTRQPATGASDILATWVLSRFAADSGAARIAARDGSRRPALTER